MIAGPGVNRGKARDELVQLEDIFPTVLEMAGLPSPDPILYVRDSTNTAGQYRPSGYPYSPGRSLLDLCRGNDPVGWRDCAYIEHYNNNMGMDGYDPGRGLIAPTPESWARSVRTKQWRYTMYPDRCGEQLFNMVDDPEETRNVAGDSHYRAVRLEMRDRLLDLVIKQDYPHSPRSRFSFGIH